MNEDLFLRSTLVAIIITMMTTIMMMMQTAIAVALCLLSSPALGFAPNHGSHFQRTSSLSMSANALIVQNKGGGHGELGTYVMTCPSIHYST
jgi:hypothetical protein